MVTKQWCDRCGKEIQTKKDDFDNIFESVSCAFEEGQQLIKKPELCNKCKVGYDKIISKVNKDIINYIKSKD